MRVGTTISTLGHALILGWTLVSFSARPFEAAPVDSLPVDIISASEFSQMTAGVKTAPKAEAPKPLVEKVGDEKPVKDPTPKVSDKQEIVSASAAEAPPPEPQPKEQEKKAEDKKPEPKTDAIAEALKKEKEQAKKPEPKPVPPKKLPQPKLDLSKIENKLALLDKREQRRNAATGATLNDKPSLGTSTGNAMALSQNEIDALRARLRDCWDVPVGVADASNLYVIVQIHFRRDGSLDAEPEVVNTMSHPAFQVAAESALRAVRKCAPYSFMPVAKYDVWKDVEVKFDPREMFRG
jgi:colicin import membrane protein